MKTCIACGVAKEVDEFYRVSRPGDRRQSRCRACYNRKSNAAKAVRIRNNAGWVNLIRLAGECVDCGALHTAKNVLEFDHIDPATKVRCISELVWMGYPWNTIRDELAKVQLRCNRCHNAKTTRMGERGQKKKEDV